MTNSRHGVKSKGQKQMAIGRLSVIVGKKGKASPHAQYIAREGKYAKPHNHQEKLENTGHGNMPAWAQTDPNYFWKMADEHERKNGSTYREHVIALPRELDKEQRHELVKDWIKNEIGDKHAYQYAIHNPPALDGGEQPHAHIMFSERLIDDIDRDPDQYFKRHNSKNPDKGGAKKANTPKKSADRKAELKAMRDRWEKTCNSHLEKAGRYERISMKSLKEQGIDREPLNFTMSQLKQPEIKQAYLNELDAKEQAYQAKLDIYRELNTSPLTELNKQIREQQKNEQEKEAKRLNSRVAEQVSTERNPNERERRLPSTGSSKGDQLGQRHTSEVGRTNSKNERPTLGNRRPKRPVEQTAPPQKEVKKQSEVTAVTEPSRNEFIENRAIFNDYTEKVDTTAKQLLNKELADMRDKGKVLLNKFEELRDNKPLLLGKKQWQQDTEKALNAYNQLKSQHDGIKDRGVTSEHHEQAKDHIAKNEPSYHAKAQQAIERLTEMQQAKRDAKAQQHGADIHAQKGKIYSGKILRADKNGIIQDTAYGKVYHPYMDGIDEGKSYQLENKGNTYTIQENREIKQRESSRDRDIER